MALHRHAPVPHGHAVAWGMLVEMILSHLSEGFPSAELTRFATYLKEQGYGAPAFSCQDYPELIGYMRHDKKNDSPDRINFTLLSAPGTLLIDRTASQGEIETALDIFRDMMH